MKATRNTATPATPATQGAKPPAVLDIASVFNRHVDTVYRLCYSYLKEPHDAEDATQAVFMKLVVAPRAFESAEHEKAWLIVCARNQCKDLLKSGERTRTTELPDTAADTVADTAADASPEPSEVLQAVLDLPMRYKDAVYLHYYEGYKTAEIAEMLDKPPSTVRNDLSDARKMLKAALEGGRHDH